MLAADGRLDQSRGSRALQLQRRAHCHILFLPRSLHTACAASDARERGSVGPPWLVSLVSWASLVACRQALDAPRPRLAGPEESPSALSRSEPEAGSTQGRSDGRGLEALGLLCCGAAFHASTARLRAAPTRGAGARWGLRQARGANILLCCASEAEGPRRLPRGSEKESGLSVPAPGSDRGRRDAAPRGHARSRAPSCAA